MKLMGISIAIMIKNIVNLAGALMMVSGIILLFLGILSFENNISHNYDNYGDYLVYNYVCFINYNNLSFNDSILNKKIIDNKTIITIGDKIVTFIGDYICHEGIRLVIQNET